MNKVRVLVLGLGNFGRSWATSIVPACKEYVELVAVVDQRKESWTGIDDTVPKFELLEAAIEAADPEMVINVTPPSVHSKINEFLLRKGIAVLCEKPIADSYESAVGIGKVLKETGGFLMIGENYRYHTAMREAKKVLDSGCLGKIHQVACYFRHYHPDYSMFYHGSLAHPLLDDVTIHHLDLARYLSNEEPLKVWCKEFSAEYSWYAHRPASAFLVTEMTGNVIFHYEGTLASPVSTTDWNGDWEVGCDNGVLQIKSGKVLLHRNGKVEEIFTTVKEEDSRITMLKEACIAFREGRKAETDFTDNMKSFAWVKTAVLSSDQQDWVSIKKNES